MCFRVIIQSSVRKLSGKAQSVTFGSVGGSCFAFGSSYFACAWVTRDYMPWHSEVFNTYSLQSVCFLSALGLLIAFAYWFVVCSVTCFKQPLPYVTVKRCIWDWPGRMECSKNCRFLLNWADLGSALWSGLEMSAPCVSNPGTVVSIVCGVLPVWSWDARNAQATVVIESDSVYGFQNGSERSPSPPLWIMDESNLGSTMSVSWREIAKAHFLFTLQSHTKYHMCHVHRQIWNSKNRTALIVFL